ncbi:FAD dependent oxidoreductase [Sphingobium cloacae]|uniref:FAD dependent oxidoreductase n=1 Tax=Sphingobium cloacae TaxID=120107 RepID=A0A1E1EXU6_9SPHN|nr:FAD dependent oxidoreductase [Sphingobium cloacae]
MIGAGIMGTATAQALAAAGVDVALVEADRIGSGASSTPGGFVVPHFSVGSPAAVIDRIGEVGERLVQATGASAGHLFDKVRRLGIDCDARQGGWYQPAHSARAMAGIEQVAAQWQDRGFPVSLLSAEQTAEHTGVQGYKGSWFAPSGGTIHPLTYCRGLADAAVAAGARLFEQSPVRSMTPQGGRHLLNFATGALSAERVVVCTNGLSAALVPAMTRSIIPLSVWQCATAPIPADERRHLFQNGEALSDTREHLFTYRFDRDGRLITGALDAFGVSPRRQSDNMACRLRKMLRLKHLPLMTHRWIGTSSVSAPRYPATLFSRDGVLSATACNARGIALSTVVGDALASHLLTGETPPIPLLEAGDTRTAGLQRRLRRFYPHMGPILDWIDTRRAPA